MTRHALAKRSSKTGKPPGGMQSAPPQSQHGAAPRPQAASASSSQDSSEPGATAGTGRGAASGPVHGASAAKTASPTASGDNRQAGPADPNSTTTATAGSAERKANPAASQASAFGATGPKVTGSGAGSPLAAASNPPRPGDRTFVGQPKPRDPAEIGLGSVVLAHEGPDEGWWEAEVIGINGRVFSLRWRDYPTQPTILRKATELALLPPGEA
ncbi:hypothetical protein SAMN04488125_14213 [Methylorubrum salsuginis]|uniref:Uncharacterized protein n=1 Tax=Methylorubrum salsuginis TaxID=414703 RepID=A0A1I4MQ44_9HYPH|nr:hypothetical protein SAMN04488125_14213 [Methylorubrum salsuginis]